MRKYNNYKNSGIEWVGDIPTEWNVTKYKFVLSIKNGFPFKSELFDNQEGFPLLRIRDITSGKLETFYKGEFSEDFVIKKGDVIVGMDGDFNIRWWDNDDALLNQRCCAIKNIESVTNLRFLFYLLPIDLKIVNDLTYYTTVKHLSNGDINNSSIALPSFVEQTKIAQYLDHQTTTIDQLILQKEKLIELLKEKRQAVINEAVTKGLNPNAKMKNSGIEWLGEVPEHWNVLSLNKVIEVKDGTHDTPNYVDPTEVDSSPLVTSKDFKNGEIDFSNAKHISQTDHFEIIKRSNTEKGDILMSMIGGNIGNMVFVNVETEFSIKNVALFKTASNAVLGKFLFYILKSNLLQIQIDLKSRGGAQGFLALSDLRKLIFFKIPVSEMVEINSYLDISISKTESVLNFLATQIEKLKEYRQSIISEAVTGRIDVRDWQPNNLHIN